MSQNKEVVVGLISAPHARAIPTRPIVKTVRVGACPIGLMALRSTEEDLIWARTGEKPIHVVRWSFNQTRIVRTKRRAHECIMVWKKWKERQGWEVRGNASSGYIAYRDGEREACALRSYDPKTLSALE
jgi:hypothetical protein